MPRLKLQSLDVKEAALGRPIATPQAALDKKSAGPPDLQQLAMDLKQALHDAKDSQVVVKASIEESKPKDVVANKHALPECVSGQSIANCFVGVSFSGQHMANTF